MFLYICIEIRLKELKTKIMKQYIKELVAVIVFLILAIIGAIAVSYSANGQDAIWINGFIDGKLLVSNDEYGNTAPTFDTNLRIDLQGLDTKYGFTTVYAKFEYADINPRMIRYSAGGGFTFNSIKRFEIFPSINYGRIMRYDRAFSSFEGTLTLSYLINPKFKLSLLGALTQRNDILYRWGNKVWRESGFIGLGYKIK